MTAEATAAQVAVDNSWQTARVITARLVSHPTLEPLMYIAHADNGFDPEDELEWVSEEGFRYFSHELTDVEVVVR